MSRIETRDAGDRLAALNSQTLGTVMPTVTLPNGERVQTGTVGALIININHYDELMKQPTIDTVKQSTLEASLRASLPVLQKANMFTLFTPDEWIQGSSPGRRYVGELALKDYNS